MENIEELTESDNIYYEENQNNDENEKAYKMTLFEVLHSSEVLIRENILPFMIMNISLILINVFYYYLHSYIENHLFEFSTNKLQRQFDQFLNIPFILANFVLILAAIFTNIIVLNVLPSLIYNIFYGKSKNLYDAFQGSKKQIFNNIFLTLIVGIMIFLIQYTMVLAYVIPFVTFKDANLISDTFLQFILFLIFVVAPISFLNVLILYIPILSSAFKLKFNDAVYYNFKLLKNNYKKAYSLLWITLFVMIIHYNALTFLLILPNRFTFLILYFLLIFGPSIIYLIVVHHVFIMNLNDVYMEKQGNYERGLSFLSLNEFNFYKNLNNKNQNKME